MAQISNQIFGAPTTVYDPSRQIAERMGRMSDQISGAITRESQRLQAEQANFAEMYSNLGEIEVQLQENYAGIKQKMVDSTRDFLKEHYRSGKSTTDPEFIAELSKKTGRIRAGMANADRNREQLKQAVEIIKNDPAILEKTTAMTSLMQRFNDPDFLISQNAFNVEEALEEFVNPQKVFESVFKNIPSDGVFEDVYDDERGNTRKTEITFNKLIPRDAPVLSDGRPNIVIPPDFLQDVMEGKYGNRIINQTQRIAEERYSDMPNDLAFANALRDGFSTVAGSMYKDRVVETSEQKRRREEQERLARERSLASRETQEDSATRKQREEQEKTISLWNRFTEGIQTGDESILGEYNMKGVKDMKFYRPEESEIYNVLSDQERWEKQDRDTRMKMMRDYGVPTPWLFTYSDTEEFRQQVLDAFIQKDKPAVTFKRRTGTKDGKAVWETETLPISTQSEIENAFRTLENIRKTGQGTAVVTEVPREEQEDPMDLLDIFE